METQLTLTNEAEIQTQLARHFDSHSTRNVGGTDLTYLTGEQVTGRLNEVLGIFGWQTRIIEHGYNQEADEIWALCELTCWNPLDRSIVVTRQQFGSDKVKRRNADQTPLDIGFNLKGAATDALKKCASLVGIGLYLWDKEEVNEIQREERHAAANVTPIRNPDVARNQIAANAAQIADVTGPVCEQCGEELKEIRFRDGTTWTPDLLASYGRRKHGHVYCMEHYRAANDAKKQAESRAPELDSVPF